MTPNPEGINSQTGGSSGTSQTGVMPGAAPPVTPIPPAPSAPLSLTAKASVINTPALAVRFTPSPTGPTNEILLFGYLKIEAEWKANETFATVPAGYRPLTEIFIVVLFITSKALKLARVKVNGEVQMLEAATADTAQFDSAWPIA